LAQVTQASSLGPLHVTAVQLATASHSLQVVPSSKRPTGQVQS